MPSTELDDLMVMADKINERIAPVQLRVNKTHTEAHDLRAPSFRVERHTGGRPAWKAVIYGEEAVIAAFLYGLSEGVSCALRRW